MSSPFHIFAILLAGLLALPTVRAESPPTTLRNLAGKKSATASSTRAKYIPANAVDGDPKTRWSQGETEGPAWLCVDLGESLEIGGCEIRWERNSVNYRFTVESSVDGKDWRLLNDQRGNDERGSDQKLLLPPVQARYVRLSTGKFEKGVLAGVSEWAIFSASDIEKLPDAERETFVTSSPLFDNVALGKPAVASSVQGGRVAALAVDGDPRTRWCAGDQTKPQCLEIDLEKPSDFNEVEIRWENAKAAYRYTLEGSLDGATWKILIDHRGNTRAQALERLAVEAKQIRYLRVMVTSITEETTWASICEVKAYQRH